MSPIKPENKHRYPENWKQISLQVRKEAGQRCETCGVCNGSKGYRHGPDGEFRALSRSDQPIALQTLKDALQKDVKLTKIVITVHHRDGQPENCDRENLVALCQRCHLLADRGLRAAKAALESMGDDNE